MKYILMKRLVTVFVLLVTINVLLAQSDVPAPAPKQQQTIYLTHATVHTGDGKVLENATVGFTNGVITMVEVNPSFKTSTACDCSPMQRTACDHETGAIPSGTADLDAAADL